MRTEHNRVKKKQKWKRMCRQALKLWLHVCADLTNLVESIENNQEASLTQLLFQQNALVY
jgi:hypothetical protein